MVYQVLKANIEKPLKNDFVKMYEKYLIDLDFYWSFEEIERMSQWSYKKLVKSKTKIAGLKYLLEQKGKQTKTIHLNNDVLSIQEYLVGGFWRKCQS